MGLSTGPGGALVAPGILKSVSAKQAEKNAIHKDHRKAAEEQRLRHRSDNDGGGGSGVPSPRAA